MLMCTNLVCMCVCLCVCVCVGARVCVFMWTKRNWTFFSARRSSLPKGRGKIFWEAIFLEYNLLSCLKRTLLLHLRFILGIFNH